MGHRHPTSARRPPPTLAPPPPLYTLHGWREYVYPRVFINLHVKPMIADSVRWTSIEKGPGYAVSGGNYPHLGHNSADVLDSQWLHSRSPCNESTTATINRSLSRIWSEIVYATPPPVNDVWERRRATNEKEQVNGITPSRLIGSTERPWCEYAASREIFTATNGHWYAGAAWTNVVRVESFSPICISKLKVQCPLYEGPRTPAAALRRRPSPEKNESQVFDVRFT
ncbi:unnamed protein product, partial [Iphiclides podalirius]